MEKDCRRRTFLLIQSVHLWLSPSVCIRAPSVANQLFGVCGTILICPSFNCFSSTTDGDPPFHALVDP
jgi:hypothetical protein